VGLGGGGGKEGGWREERGWVEGGKRVGEGGERGWVEGGKESGWREEREWMEGRRENRRGGNRYKIGGILGVVSVHRYILKARSSYVRFKFIVQETFAYLMDKWINT